MPGVSASSTEKIQLISKLSVSENEPGKSKIKVNFADSLITVAQSHERLNLITEEDNGSKSKGSGKAKGTDIERQDIVSENVKINKAEGEESKNKKCFSFIKKLVAAGSLSILFSVGLFYLSRINVGALRNNVQQQGKSLDVSFSHNNNNSTLDSTITVTRINELLTEIPTINSASTQQELASSLAYSAQKPGNSHMPGGFLASYGNSIKDNSLRNLYQSRLNNWIEGPNRPVSGNDHERDFLKTMDICLYLQDVTTIDEKIFTYEQRMQARSIIKDIFKKSSENGIPEKYKETYRDMQNILRTSLLDVQAAAPSS